MIYVYICYYLLVQLMQSKSSTKFKLYNVVTQSCSATNCLGHGHGYECHSSGTTMCTFSDLPVESRGTHRCLRKKHSFLASLDHTMQQQKLLSSPRFGALAAYLSKYVFLRRCVFCHRHGHHSPPDPISARGARASAVDPCVATRWWAVEGNFPLFCHPISCFTCQSHSIFSPGSLFTYCRPFCGPVASSTGVHGFVHIS